MKKTYVLASLLLLAPAATQAQEEGRIESSGGVTAGAQAVDVDPDSSKFEEYRDMDEGFYLYDIWLDLLDTETGGFLEFEGENLIRDDQFLRLQMGDYGRGLQLGIEHNEIPHVLSNKARTPYIYRGDGLFTVPVPVLDAPIVGVPNDNANVDEMVLNPADPPDPPAPAEGNDLATAAWLATTLHDTDLGTQRDKTSATLHYSPLSELKFRFTFSDEQKDGSKITYGPLGNRPPNTMNIQFAEPIEYETRELKFETEYNQPAWQALFSYVYSDFEDEIDTLRWQNIWAFDADVDNLSGFTGTLSGADLADDLAGSPDHLIATFGQRALNPDNDSQRASLSVGIDLPLASRLTATAAYGWMEQDETLLPYSSSAFGTATIGAARDLPRGAADAEIDTKLLNVDYTINPVDRLNLRAFARYYDLENDTPQDQWWYVTSDAVTSGNVAAGETTDLNQRINLAYSYDQLNYGLETAYNLAFWRTTLGLGYEREEIDREFRPADTDENIFKASVRFRPADRVTLQAKYLYGDREGDTYNGDAATDASYWGDFTETHNPVNTFGNHPDMRQFDVSDRERDQVDLAATVMPTEAVDLTASYRYRNDDYDSGVTPVQPLRGSTIAGAETTLFTAGDQLGLLERETQRYALDAVYAPSERLTLTGFGSRETIESTQRNMEFNEDFKTNPSARAGNDLGGWDASFADQSQWMAETDDETDTVGLGVGYELIPGKLRLATDYTYSQGEVDIAYSGLGSEATGNPVAGGEGVTSGPLPDPTNPFAFSSPPTVKHNQYILNASLEYQLVENVVLGLHYLFDRYKISDWMQESDQPWFESVGSEFLLRDTSESKQWGNRLVNLGSYLGPTYEAHLGAVTMTYRF